MFDDCRGAAKDKHEAVDDDDVDELELLEDDIRLSSLEVQDDPFELHLLVTSEPLA